MKKFTFFFGFMGIVGTVCSQNQTPSYSASFEPLYKAAALHPGRYDGRGIVHDSVIKRWDKDIKIYVEGGSSRCRKEILGKLNKTIAIITPALDNKIKISFTNDKPSSNYIISLDFMGRSGWHLRWDALDNIYSCVMLVNTEALFNREQQADLVSHYFLQSLGDFVFKTKDRSDLIKNDRSIASNISVWRQDINDIDLQILKLHYSDDIKPGMAEKEIDQFFERHK